MQNRMEQQQEKHHPQWKNLLENDKIEDPANLITTTMKNLPPPINIFQYYQTYKPLIMKDSSLHDIWNRSHI